MSEARWSIPNAWAWASVESVAAVVGGGTPPASDPANFDPQGIPWVTPADLTGFEGSHIGRGARSLSTSGYSRCGAQMLPAGAVLLSSRAPVGYCAVAANDLCTNQGFKSLVLQGAVDPLYVRHYFRGSIDYLEENASGTTFKELSGGRVSSLSMPVAPLEEQRRIVAKIDSLSAKSTLARDRLRHASRLVNKYKQAVLTAAFRGELTAAWRTSNAHGSVEYEGSNKSPSDDLPELPPTWRWVQVAVISTKVVDGVHKKPNYVESGVPFLTVRNLTAGPGVSFEGCRFVSVSDHAEFIKRTHPEKGDILITKDGTLGVVRQVATNRPFSIFVSLALVKPTDRKISDYLELAFSSPLMQQQMIGVGSGLQHIHLTDLRKDFIPIAPPLERQQIVVRLRQAFAWIDRLAAEATSARALIDRLDQAVLAKAFRGELVPQDPADEPASVLLERIRAERAGAPAAKRRGRPRAPALP